MDAVGFATKDTVSDFFGGAALSAGVHESGIGVPYPRRDLTVRIPDGRSTAGALERPPPWSGTDVRRDGGDAAP